MTTPQPLTTLSDLCSQPPVTIPNDAQTWDRRASDKHAFEFHIGALEPNTCYKLTFVQQLQAAGEVERKELQAQLAKQLREQVRNDVGFISLTTTAARVAALNQTVQTFVRDKFRACAPQVTDADVIPAQAEIFDQSTKIVAANTGIASRLKEASEEFCIDGACDVGDASSLTAADWTQFRNALSELIRDPAGLSDGSKTHWSSPVNAALEEHKSTTFAALARLIDVLLVRPHDLQALLAGRFKITGTSLQASTKPDPASIFLVADFLDFVLSDNFVLKNNTPAMPQRLRARASTLVNELRRLAQRYREKAAAEATIEASTFPDVLANKLLNQTATLTSSPTLITPGKNPFIHADVGFAYGARVDKAFPYAGVNFYFTPVNKDASLAQFRGWQRWSKRTSLLLGVSMAGFEDTRNKNFVAGGALLLGGGFRVTQYIKVSAGGLAFKRADPNPLKADKLHNKYVPFVSISIGNDLKTLLGTAGNLFGN